MAISPLRLVRRCAEYQKQESLFDLPRGLRGIYVLYKHRPRLMLGGRYDVVYVGMTATGRKGGIRSRLKSHQRRKGDLWSHFSVFEVWENIRDDEIAELEGLFRHIYQRDSQANSLNVARRFRALKELKVKDLRVWQAR